MSLLAVRGVSYEYSSGLALFRATSFSIDPGDRAALIGPNGCGKSTLLRLLAGEDQPTTGQIVRRRGLRVEYLPQILEQDQHSAGQRLRAALQVRIDARPDLLLLDEPTNHLDCEALAWLRGQINRFSGAVVLVSHDRAFLDETATRILSFERDTIVACEGNYSDYLRDRDTRLHRQWAEYNAEQRRLSADRAAAEKRMSLSRKVARAPAGVRSSHDFYNRKAAQVARTSRLLKERARLRPDAPKPWEEQPIPDLTFDHVHRSGDVAVSARDVSFAYNRRPVFEALNFHVRRAERWALTGPNGSGKTTLLRLISGAAQPACGDIQLGAHVRVAYLTQECDDLDPRATPLDLCLAERNDVTQARTLLACLKLPAALVERPISTLSAGERTKSALTRVLLSGANVLLLDEPTNHLEIEARAALEAALSRFPGTLIFTSHDPWFVRALVTHSLSLPGGGTTIEA